LPGYHDGVFEARADQLGGEYFRRWPGCQRPAVAQQQRVRGGGRKLFEVVGDEHGRELWLFVAQGVQAGQQLFAPGEVKAGGGLVE